MPAQEGLTITREEDAAAASILDPSVSLSLRGEAGAASPPIDWLLGLLREAMTGVMEGDDPPLRKAGAVARLDALYLKACGLVELRQANKALTARVTQLEQRLVEAGAAADASLARTALGEERLPGPGLTPWVAGQVMNRQPGPDRPTDLHPSGQRPPVLIEVQSHASMGNTDYQGPDGPGGRPGPSGRTRAAFPGIRRAPP